MILVCAHSHLMPVSACMQKSREKLKYEDEEIENQYYPSIILFRGASNGHSDPSN